MKLTLVEHETIINTNMQDDVAHIYTRIPKHHHHFERLGIKPTKVHKDSDGNEFAWEYQVPEKWVKMPKGRTKMVLSEEQKQRLRERLGKARLAKKP